MSYITLNLSDIKNPGIKGFFSSRANGKSPIQLYAEDGHLTTLASLGDHDSQTIMHVNVRTGESQGVWHVHGTNPLYFCPHKDVANDENLAKVFTDPDDVLCIAESISAGYRRYLRIKAAKSAFEKLNPCSAQEKPKLSNQDIWTLDKFKCLNSRGRKDAFQGVTFVKVAMDRLLELGFVKRKGSGFGITKEGQNAHAMCDVRSARKTLIAEGILHQFCD